MADLTSTQSAQAVILVGADLTGTEQTPVGSDNQGNAFVKLKDSSGQDIGTADNPLYISNDGVLYSPLPRFVSSRRIVLAAGLADYSTYTMTSKVALKEFHLGGRRACEGTIAKYDAINQELVPGGDFESSGDVSQWTNTSVGSSASTSWTYSTAQFYTGSGSASKTFTQSNSSNYPEITYTWSTPQDLSKWRYISAAARVTVATGGSQSRTIQIRLKSGTAIRIWQIAGTTTTAPFNTEQWLQIVGELENPSATAGTGVFDINSVNSISLRLVDGGNKSGTIYWDAVRLSGYLDIRQKIYTDGPTRQLIFDPYQIFEIGDVVALIVKNNASTSTEVQITTSGVEIP